MVVDGDRVLDDLLRFEVTQVDDGHSGVRLVVDEHELAVVVAAGLGERGVVRVRPGDLLIADVALGEDSIGSPVAVSPALPGLRGENADGLQETHGRHADHEDLSGVAAGGEHDVRIDLAGWHVRQRRGGELLVGER